MTAEFYDILQAESDSRLAERRLTAAARAARVGIVDIGAGTGIVTEVLLACSAVPLHAVEPAMPMRVALLSRLAGLGADQRARVTVHPVPLQTAGLEQAADLLVCSNVAGVVDPAQRRALWKAAAVALVPGGVLLVDPPPQRLPDAPTVRNLPPVRVGPDIYSARVRTEADRGLLSVTYTYLVERGDEIVRVEEETFTMWPAEPDTIFDELCEAGLRPRDEQSTGMIRASLGAAPAEL